MKSFFSKMNAGYIMAGMAVAAGFTSLYYGMNAWLAGLFFLSACPTAYFGWDLSGVIGKRSCRKEDNDDPLYIHNERLKDKQNWIKKYPVGR